MGAAYSDDLRLRVLESIDKGMSKMRAHQTFRVSRSTIDDWILLREQTGAVTAKAHVRHGPVPAISDLAAFEAFAQRHPGTTLKQMAQAWEQETGQKLSINTFSVALRRIGWTRKKRASFTASGMQETTSRSESSTLSS